MYSIGSDLAKASLRTVFNEDESNYDYARPSYPEALYTDIRTFLRNGKNEGRYALEIGIGTGQATKPFLDAGFHVTAVELGDKLAAYSAEKYRTYSNFRVICADFMDAKIDYAGSFDLLYAATSFHWLPKPFSYLRAREMLRDGGAIALFWNHPYMRRQDDATNVAAAAVYDRLRPARKEILEFNESMTEPILFELRQSGFRNAAAKLYHRMRTLSTEQYLALLNTYSDHRALNTTMKNLFAQEMRDALDRVGGKINIYDTIDLYLAEK